MITNIPIDDELLAEVRTIAIEEDKSVSDVMTEAVRRFLNSRHSPDNKKRFVMPVFGGNDSSEKADTSPAEFYALGS